MHQPRPARDTEIHVLIVREDGEVLGGAEYPGGPVVAVLWCDDPAEFQRRTVAALESAAIRDRDAAAAK